MQPLEYTAAQRDKVLDDLFAMLPSHNGLVIERLYHSNRRYAIRSFANPAESVDSVRDCKIFCVNPILTQGFIQEYLHERINRSFA